MELTVLGVERLSQTAHLECLDSPFPDALDPVGCGYQYAKRDILGQDFLGQTLPVHLRRAVDESR